MSPATGRMSTLRLVATGTFFCGYLLFQVVYPVVPWMLPGYGRFTWSMYSGRGESPEFAVQFADGSRRDVDNPLRFGAPVRLLSATVSQRRFLPPWLCAHWDGAERVIIREAVTGREVTVPCRPLEP